jgi:hypothetical protein
MPVGSANSEQRIMMRSIYYLALAAVAVAVAIAGAQAQFPGYPPANSFFIGNDSLSAPTWRTLSQTQGILGLGTMASQNANAVAITGGTITGMPAPVVATDVVNKAYVDGAIVGIVVHPQVKLATTVALPANTYANGTAGVGATLTAIANAALSVDGVAVATSDRITVKNEAAAANNGIYVVTQTGSVSAPYILTRATDANTAGSSDASKIGINTYTFVLAGSVNTSTAWIVNAPVTTIGTSAITWTQFSGGGGVTSLNSLNGTLTLAPGTGMAVTQTGPSTIAVGLSTVRQTLPTSSIVTIGSHTGGFAANGSGTYTTPPNVLWLDVTEVGGGAGGQGAGGVGGGNGGPTCWNTSGAACTSAVYLAAGGAPGFGGGTLGPCVLAVQGGNGNGGSQSLASGSVNIDGTGGPGAGSSLGGGGSGFYNSNGGNGSPNSGGGGGGGAANHGAGTLTSGTGGGSGGTCRAIINNPAATYTYAVGAGGAFGNGTGFGFNGGQGAGGQIMVIEHYGS